MSLIKQSLPIPAYIPVTSIYTDSDNRQLQLWRHLDRGLFGTVIDLTGKINYIPFEKLINPCGSSLENFLLEPCLMTKWDLVYQEQTNKIIVWPHLQAAGKSSVKSIPTKKSIPLDLWKKPTFSEKKEKLGHIFRNELGHLPKDTPENRRTILEAVSKSENFIAMNKFNEALYLQLLPDGTQAWALVNKDNIIVNAGCNRFPKKYVLDPTHIQGGRLMSIKYAIAEPNDTDLKIRTLSNKLSRYRDASSDKKVALQSLASKSIQGVGNITGIISNMFDTDSANAALAHILFLPTEGSLLLSDPEVLQLAIETARGIFLYKEVPWFSLHFNFEKSQYPIIHPVYQNSFVGYTIAFLDYSMKALVNGCYYPEEFVVNWHKNPNFDESYLTKNLHSFHEYCSQHGQPYLSFREIFKEISGANPSANEQPTQITYNLVAKQNSIKRKDNLFLIDDSFDIQFSIKGNAISDEGNHLHQFFTEAANRMRLQMINLMPKLPMYQKHMQALSLINFFSYYYSTLQKNEKLPIFPLIVNKDFPSCPPTFPPLALSFSNYEQIPFAFDAFFDSLTAADKAYLFDVIKNKNPEKLNQAEQITANALKAYILKIAPTAASRANTAWPTFGSFFLNKLQLLHANFDLSMNNALVVRDCKASLIEPNSEAILSRLLSQNDSCLRQAEQKIIVLEQEIELKKKANQPLDKLLLDLNEAKKSKEGVILNTTVTKLWFENSVIACVWGKLCTVNLEQMTLSFESKKAKTQPYISGGLSISIQDMEANADPVADSLLNHYEKNLNDMQHNTIMKIKKFGANKKSGAFVKLPFESNSDEIDKDALIPIFYPRKQPLTESEYLVFDAISNGDIALFKKLAAKIANWNFQDPQGITVIHYASAFQNTDLLEYLIQQKAPLHIKTPHGYTPFHYAARAGSEKCLKLLITHARELLNTADNAGRTPLYLAVQENHPLFVKSILQEGANPNIPTTQGTTPLFCSIHLKLENIALDLLASNLIDIEYKFSADGSTALHLAVEKQMLLLSEKLLNQQIDATICREQKYTPLHIAAANGWLAGVTLLLENRPNLDLSQKTTFGATALDLATLENHTSVCDFLKTKNPIAPLQQSTQKPTHSVPTSSPQPNNPPKPRASIFKSVYNFVFRK